MRRNPTGALEDGELQIEAVPAADPLDRKLELLLDESVASRAGTEALPEGFASRVAASRPFAPWEVRQARAWRVPLGVGALLLGGSAGLGLAPLWTLGPATAIEVWTDLVLAGSVRPVVTLVEALPLLGRGVARVSGSVPGLVAATLVLLGVAGAAALSRGFAPAAGRRGADARPR